MSKEKNPSAHPRRRGCSHTISPPHLSLSSLEFACVVNFVQFPWMYFFPLMGLQHLRDESWRDACWQNNGVVKLQLCLISTLSLSQTAELGIFTKKKKILRQESVKVYSLSIQEGGCDNLLHPRPISHGLGMKCHGFSFSRASPCPPNSSKTLSRLGALTVPGTGWGTDMYNTNNKSSFSERITEGPTHHLKKGSQVQEQQLKKKKKKTRKMSSFLQSNTC